MLIRDFLSEAIFKLPKIQSSKRDYKQFVFSHLDDFIKKLHDLGNQLLSFEDLHNYSISSILKRQIYLVSKIKETLNYYYDGKPFKAYRSLDEGLESDIKIFYEVLNIKEFYEGDNFYRIRVHKENFPLSIGSFFHIPFDKRGLVKTQRFSIPGFPSLYLGTSIYVCWEELNRPNVNDFQAVRLTNTQRLKIIDLSLLTWLMMGLMIYINI